MIVQNSGKLLILGILAVALLLAGASWWFRYNATHQAALFWGPEASQLIRDAPSVTLLDLQPGNELGFMVDVSHAPGMTHLRNALLEDRSFDWPSPAGLPPANDDFAQHWGLSFDDPDTQQQMIIAFSADCRRAARVDENLQTPRVISTVPIAAGLIQMFDEMSRPTAPLAR
jgi:hypothetical protein